MLELKQKVEKGVKLLNEKLGKDWIDKIDLEILDERRGTMCILAQLGNEKNVPYGVTDNVAIEYGLKMKDLCSTEGYQELTEIWKEKIAELRKPKFNLVRGV